MWILTLILNLHWEISSVVINFSLSETNLKLFHVRNCWWMSNIHVLAYGHEAFVHTTFFKSFPLGLFSVLAILPYANRGIFSESTFDLCPNESWAPSLLPEASWSGRAQSVWPAVRLASKMTRGKHCIVMYAQLYTLFIYMSIWHFDVTFRVDKYFYKF